MALWWEKKETLHFDFSFGKIALSKLLQNVESPFRGAAPLKAHIAPQDPEMGSMGWKGSSLNAPGTENPLSHSILKLDESPFSIISPLG